MPALLLSIFRFVRLLLSGHQAVAIENAAPVAPDKVVLTIGDQMPPCWLQLAAFLQKSKRPGRRGPGHKRRRVCHSKGGLDLQAAIANPQWTGIARGWLPCAVADRVELEELCRVRGALSCCPYIRYCGAHPARGGHVTAGGRGWMARPFFRAS